MLKLKARFGVLGALLAVGLLCCGCALFRSYYYKLQLVQDLRVRSFSVEAMGDITEDNYKDYQRSAHLNVRDLFRPIINIVELPQPCNQEQIRDRQRLLAQIGRLRQLEGLQLAQTPINENICRALHQLPKLQRLRVGEATSSKMLGKAFKHLPHVTELDLSFSRIDDCSAKELGQVSNLRTLDLSHTQLPCNAMKHLIALRHLSELSVRGSDSLDAECIKALAMIGSLKSLDLSDSNISDVDLLILADSSSLRHVTLLRAVDCSKEGVERFRALRPDVTLVTDFN